MWLLPLEAVPPTWQRNGVTVVQLGALMSAIWICPFVQSMDMHFWWQWHFTSYFIIWVQMLVLYAAGACGIFCLHFNSQLCRHPTFWLSLCFIFCFSHEVAQVKNMKRERRKHAHTVKQGHPWTPLHTEHEKTILLEFRRNIRSYRTKQILPLQNLELNQVLKLIRNCCRHTI